MVCKSLALLEKNSNKGRDAGAYGFSMASNYNSRLRPAEVLVINGEAKLIRERETLDDLTRNQVDVNI